MGFEIKIHVLQCAKNQRHFGLIRTYNLRGHHDHVSYPIFLNVMDHGFRIKGFMYNIGASHKHPGHQVQHGPVEHDGTGMQANAFRRHPECRCKDATVHGPDIVGVDNSLWRTSSATRIHDIIHI